MRAEAGLDDPGDEAALEHIVARFGRSYRKPIDDLVGADETAFGGAREMLVEEGVGAFRERIAHAVGARDVEQRDVERDGGHRQQHFAVVIGRGDRPELGIDAHHVGAQPGAGWQERDAHRGGTQAPLKQPLVEFARVERPGLSRLAEEGVGRDRVHRDEAVDQPAHLARS